MTDSTQQPEIAFLLAWLKWSEETGRDRARAAELLPLAEEAGMSLIERAPSYRKVALLGMWLGANADTDFELEVQVLRITKTPFLHGIQYWVIRATQVHLPSSVDRSATIIGDYAGNENS
jgi:hypothetical protein